VTGIELAPTKIRLARLLSEWIACGPVLWARNAEINRISNIRSKITAGNAPTRNAVYYIQLDTPLSLSLLPAPS
jgi:hypothetical protein